MQRPLMQKPLIRKPPIRKPPTRKPLIRKPPIRKPLIRKPLPQKLMFHWLLVLILAIGTASRPADAYIFQLDSARPYLTINGVRVQWNNGAGAQWLLSSLLARVHPRGVFFKPQTWHMRDISGLGWTAHSCIPSAYGLCQTRSSVIFPSNEAPVVNQYREGKCQSSSTGPSTGRVITNGSRYDVSACDVLDASLDYVYEGNSLWEGSTELPTWIYWTVCILVVYLVRCLSKYILGSLERKNSAKRDSKPASNANHNEGVETKQDNPKLGPNPILCLCASLGCLVLIVSPGDACFVTEEDLLFYRYTVFYICVYALLFIGTRAYRALKIASGHDPQFYNLLAGVLQLVATRLYVGAETPYNPPLIFIIAVRALVKCRRRVDLILCITLLLDAFMLALMCSLGFSPDPHYLLALFASAAAWVDFLV